MKQKDLWKLLPPTALIFGCTFHGSKAQAHALGCVQFLVVDAKTHKPIPGGRLVLEDGKHAPIVLAASVRLPGMTPAFDLVHWRVADFSTPSEQLIPLAAGRTLMVQSQTSIPTADIYVKVTATRLQLHPSDTASVTRIDPRRINTFVNKAGGDIKSLTQGQPSVASDSAGQQHIRGEHADITYVVDGVPLPDTLSGRQGSLISPSTIQGLEMLTGGYAPEFGGQTAAIMNITTTPGASKSTTDATLQAGGYGTKNQDIATAGPIGKQFSYVVDLGSTRTNNAIEPQQPDNQTAHNAGSGQSYFAKVRATPSRRDIVNVTLSRTPGALQINNRTGLPSSFANVGQGFGFLGLRNADGTRPDVTADNAGALGAAPDTLPSQQAAGQDINQREVSEFATISERRQLNPRDSATLALTLLHSGQNLSNNSPRLDPLNLPVDNSIEFNPAAERSIHHVQGVASITAPRGKHEFKGGILLDNQSGSETYQLTPASQLALNDLANLAPNLVPTGNVQMDSAGKPVVDVNGNPVYTPTSSVVPTLNIHRTGFYRAAFLQDTWKPTKAFTANYGLRFDWYRQAQGLGFAPVDTKAVSPRLNLSYAASPLTVLRVSYNRLFNTPPLAQGANIGKPIIPEKINQYDVSIHQQLSSGQTLGVAYYYKQIRDQVDTSLLIPGSWLGLYSAVNFQFGAVHGIEATYEVSPPKGVGLDGYLNYTYSIAKPNGVDSLGAHVPEYNDHDQRHTVGAGLAYLFKGGESAAVSLNYGSGLASSSIMRNGPRTPRTQVDLHVTTGPLLFRGAGGVGFDVINLFDARSVINFQSGFSGTRFMQGRRILGSAFLHF